MGTLCRPYLNLVMIEWENGFRTKAQGFDEEMINCLSSEDGDMTEAEDLWPLGLD